MRGAVVLILAALPSFLVLRTSLFDPRRAEIEAAFERADAVLRAQASNRQEYWTLVPPADRSFGWLLPAGYWRLLIRAFPGVALDRYVANLDAPYPDRLAAQWGIYALAEDRYPAAKSLLLGRLSSSDPEVRTRVVRTLRHFMDPSLTPHLIALLPPRFDEYDRNEIGQAVLETVTWSLPPDRKAVRAAIDRFRADNEGFWFSTEAARLRLAFYETADPVLAADRLLSEGRKEDFAGDAEAWLPAYAAHRGLVALAPLLRRRVDEEIRRETDEENRRWLDPAAADEPLNPSWDAPPGFRAAFVLAAYRTALRDLGVPLTDEERRWLEAHRLLRPAREYLVEAGILSRR